MYKNLEKLRAWEKSWRKKNPEKIREIKRRHRSKHRDKINAYKRSRRHLDLPAKRAWNKANPERLKSYYLKREYGITNLEYDKMLVEQHGGCAICGSEKPSRGLFVDHCHVTKKVRGLLCSKCNLGIGHFRENPHLLIEAVLYLTGSK